ncbi:MAG: response regulator [Mariprofundus sp.]
MNQHRWHILIIEDNETIREVLPDMLEIWLEIKGIHADIHEACNGAEGLDWVKAHGVPELLLLDVRMPVMNGAEFLHQISMMGLDVGKQTLLLTGYADDLEEHLGRDALLMQHLRKPFMAPELFAKLDQVIS